MEKTRTGWGWITWYRIREKIFILRHALWDIWHRWLFVTTGDCGHFCGTATFRKLDGTPFQQFVPEADCPIHDITR
jgi:hypothetical protein